MPTMKIKRIYEPASSDDGARVLVDRLWPRGMTKEAARLDLWLKDVAPSDALRRWFDHRAERWDQFRQRYRAELAENSAVGELRALMKDGRVTLLYSARDAEHNQAVVLAEYLQARTSARKKPPRRKST